jgi:TetR/AcrR family transcriptional repressor of nem operon
MTTYRKLVDSARHLIQTRGYNGFSYADVAEEVQVKKASIHHHFPAKSDLARAVVDQSRALIVAQTQTLAGGAFDPQEQLAMYTGYWERCIADASAPFCIAGMLAAELTTLPAALADEVRAHFHDLSNWLEVVLTKGSQMGLFDLHNSARVEAATFMATVYGAMLMARAYGDPKVFAQVVENSLDRLVRRKASGT